MSRVSEGGREGFGGRGTAAAQSLPSMTGGRAGRRGKRQHNQMLQFKTSINHRVESWRERERESEKERHCTGRMNTG